MGVSAILSSGVRKFFRGGPKFLRFDIFSRDADCQLGGSQENVSIVSARGGVPKWAFLASADMWMTPKGKGMSFGVISQAQEQGFNSGNRVSLWVSKACYYFFLISKDLLLWYLILIPINTRFFRKIRLSWIRVMLLIQLKVSLCDKLVLFIPIGTFNSQVRNILFI